MIDVKIDLNKSLNSFSNRIKVRQGDVGEKMRITLTDNKFSLENQNNLQVKFEGNIRSGDYVEGIAIPFNDKAGEFVYQFKSEDVSIPGAYQRAFIRVYDESGNRISSEDIFVEVLKDADISNNQSKIYVSKLDELLEDFDDDFGEFLTGKEEDYSALDEKSKELNSELSDLKKGSNEIKNTQTEIIQSIEDNDLATKNDLETAKQESSANVIDQIAGAESAILKKEILVNGNEGTASRYANDLGTQNLMGILKSSRFIYDLDSNRLKAPGLIEGQTITEVTLPAGTYVVSLRLFVKSSKSTSFVCVVDGTDNSSFSFLNIQNYTINTVYTRTLELTKETQIRYKSWGNTDNEPIEFEMKIEKEKYTKFTPAPEWVIDGIVPFNEDDYNALLSTNEIVNAETYVPERGAEIVFEFPVIKALEVNRPFLFEGCTTDTEKIEKYISIMRSVLVPSASRGGGLSTATGNSSNYSRLYVKNTTNNSVRYCGTDAINSSNNLREFNTKLDTSSMKQVQKNGSYIFKITSKENENIGQSGAISDGISPAWVEVKDIRLIVEVEASANEIIKLEIAANHGEKIATQEEAEAGTDNTKTMTPLRTAQQLEKKAVTIAGNQTIGGIKNFKDGLMINDVSLSTITRKVIYEADGVGGYFNAADKFTLGASGKIDKIVLLWSRVDDTAGTLLNYSWSQTVLSPDDLVVGNSYRIQMTTDNYKFVTFANESGNVTISGANENSVAPNRIYRIKRIIAYLKN